MSTENSNPQEDASLKDMTYEQAVAELESIVQKMQSADCNIDRLADYTRRSLALLRYCKEKLTRTDAEIKRCLEELS